MERLGKTIKRPFQKFTLKSLISYLVWLPLNFIPVVGTVIFIFVQARKNGPGFHERWFQLKGYTAKQKAVFVERNKPAYIG
jgi:ABC-type molybdate transport system permease subunit